MFLSLSIVCVCAPQRVEELHREERKISVEVITLKPQKFTDEAIYFGRLVASETANLICYSGGRVEKIIFEEGSRVGAGVSLARIDASRAYTTLETARVQQSIAKSTLEQLKKHLLNGNASQLEVDQQHLVYLNARNSFIDAQKNYRGAFAISPIRGVVTKRYIDLYQEIAPNTPTFTVSKLDSLKIEFGISESDIYHVDTGTVAVLTIPMIPHRKWYGRIQNLAKAAGDEDRVFSAEAHFPNDGNDLKPGTSGRVQLSLATFDSVIVIPTRVIISEGIKNAVMIVDSTGVVQKRFIQTGPQSDSETMVQSGLKFGEWLIISGFDMVRNGVKVNVKQSDDNS